MNRINREILSLAVPSIVSNITTPLLALMDVVIVGHMGSADYIAAIAVGGTIFNMMYWLFSFLRMGSSGLTAQANGASDNESTSSILFRGLSVVVCASLLILILQVPILKLSLSILEIEGPAEEFVIQYFKILIWGAPASLCSFVLSGWLLGLKNARLPMWISFIINVSNIVVSLLLVYVFHLKVEGVAIGTLCAQYLGVIFGLIVSFRKYSPKLPNLNLLIDAKELKHFFSINTDIFLRTLCLIVVTVWFTRIGAQQGTIILAVNTLLMQFFILFSYFMDGFAYAGESLAGNYLGEKDKFSFNQCVKALFKWSSLMVIIFTLIYFICGEEIMTLLSDDKAVIGSAKEYYAWVIAIPVVGFAAFTWDGIYIGVTRTREMLISMAISTAIYFIVYYFLFPVIGNHGLWIAFLSYLLSRGVLLTILRYRLTKDLNDA